MTDLLLLTDTNYIKALLTSNHSSIATDMAHIDTVKARKIKSYFGDDFQHVVMYYRVHYTTTNGQQRIIKLFATAHSDGSRETTYHTMKFVAHHGFAQGITPLLYDPETKGLLYTKIPGDSGIAVLSAYPESTTIILDQAASAIAKWHQLPLDQAPAAPTRALNWNTLDPTNLIHNRIQHHQAEYDFLNTALTTLTTLHHAPIFHTNLVFSHGDFHPENIVVEHIDTHIIATNIIDYTDVCAADRGLDIGMFREKLTHFFTTTHPITTEQCGKYLDFFTQQYCDYAAIEYTTEFATQCLFWETWNTLKSIVYLSQFGDQGVLDSLTHTAHNKLSQLTQRIS